MKFSRYFVLFLFLTSILASAKTKDDDDHEGKLFNKDQFIAAFKEGYMNANFSMWSIDLEDGSKLEAITDIQQTTKTGAGAIDITLANWHEDDGTYEIYKTNAELLNYANQFKYSYSSIAIPEMFYDELNAELDDIRNKILEKYSDLKIEFGHENQKITISALYSYANGVSTEDIGDRIAFLLNQSRFINGTAIETLLELEENYRDKLFEQDLKYVTKTNLIYILGKWWLAELEKNDPPIKKEIKEGYFRYLHKNTYHIEMFNYGDSLIITQWIDIPNDVDGKYAGEILEKTKEIVADQGKPDGAALARAGWYPNYVEKTLLIEVKYVFDASYSGDDFFEYHNNVKYYFTPDVYDAIVELFEDYEY
ncbi:MAG: hypothetical protein KDF60_13135 [Calditrichaeota bacterium]|nr:hypothetical protein [Calditrichota bacterium]